MRLRTYRDTGRFRHLDLLLRNGSASIDLVSVFFFGLSRIGRHMRLDCDLRVEREYAKPMGALKQAIHSSSNHPARAHPVLTEGRDL